MAKSPDEGDGRRDGKLLSEALAALIVDALVNAGIVAASRVDEAVTIAAEEIEVRKALGDY